MTEVAPGFPKPRGSERPWSCRKAVAACTRAQPCPSCRGARNRRKGLVKQRQARKTIERQIGMAAGKYSSQTGNEENWRLAIRCEVKSGKQIARVASLYAAARDQSESARPHGDPRPFALVCVPDGWAGGTFLYVVHSADMPGIVEAHNDAL